MKPLKWKRLKSAVLAAQSICGPRPRGLPERKPGGFIVGVVCGCTCAVSGSASVWLVG